MSALDQDAHVPPALRTGPIYLDYNATTPIDPRVVAAMLPFLTDHFGNPSSGHAYGHAPAAAVGAARTRVAHLINAPTESVVFTGSGTESNAAAILGVVGAARRRGVPHPHVVTQSTEHPAVLTACAYAERHLGATITVLPVDHRGLVPTDELTAALTDQTVLVTVMHANNETGVIQPIAELAALAHARGALFHTDAAQSAGKVTVDVEALGVDLLTVVGHKLYAPKGVAALYVRPGVELDPLLSGGGQERGRRGGTENVPHIAALGAAAELAAADLAAGGMQRLERMRDQLLEHLKSGLPGRVHVNGGDAPRLPQTLNISILATRGPELLARCPAVAASTGSACHSGTDRPSPVLLAMGLDAPDAMAAVRLTLGRWTSDADIDDAARALVESAAP